MTDNKEQKVWNKAYTKAYKKEYSRLIKTGNYDDDLEAARQNADSVARDAADTEASEHRSKRK